jgi:hypothetical protein
MTISRLTYALILASSASALSADALKETDFYPSVELPIPAGLSLEVSAMEWMPNGGLMIGTRRGELVLVTNPGADDLSTIQFKPYASGMHEILGLAYNAKEQALYVTQRPEITKVKDLNGDGQADEFTTFYDGWGQSGDYHEYNFGSRFDAEGNLWTTLCLTGSFSSSVPWRGWCLRIDPTGKMIPTCGGVRSPGGMGFIKGDCFYTDNQGPWNGSSSLKWLKPGSFQGHDGGNKWYESPEAKASMGGTPPPAQSGSRVVTERGKVPQLIPAAIILPHSRVGQSASAIFEDLSGGKFGPFAGQAFVGDQCFSNLVRCPMEKVNGIWQGACIPFREGFRCGIIPAIQGPDGSVYVGGADRGWGSKGGKPFTLERIRWAGKVPFEVHTIVAKPDGFELTFTEPVDKVKAANPASYKSEAWTYIFQSSYGSPEVDKVLPGIESATVGADGKTVRLKMTPLTKGHVHAIEFPGLTNASGQPLVHGKVYYTLNEIPAA